MDQEVFSRLVSEVERLRISTEEIAARIRSLGDVEIVIDEEEFDALDRELVTNKDAFYQWMIRL